MFVFVAFVSLVVKTKSVYEKLRGRLIAQTAFIFGAPGMACSAFNSAVSITVVVVG